MHAFVINGQPLPLGVAEAKTIMLRQLVWRFSECRNHAK